MKNTRKIALALTVLSPVLAQAAPASAPRFTDTFAKSDFVSVGSNPFFILQPGFVQTYDGIEDGEKVHLTITVTNQTKRVAGVGLIADGPLKLSKITRPKGG